MVKSRKSYIPEPLGESVIAYSYGDANLFHDMINGRAVAGTMHFVNGTPGDWYTKRQATVETATYGAEFVAARIAVDQIVDLEIYFTISWCQGGREKLFI
jgi:hypothetical protein